MNIQVVGTRAEHRLLLRCTSRSLVIISLARDTLLAAPAGSKQHIARADKQKSALLRPDFDPATFRTASRELSWEDL